VSIQKLNLKSSKDGFMPYGAHRASNQFRMVEQHLFAFFSVFDFHFFSFFHYEIVDKKELLVLGVMQSEFIFHFDV